MARLGRGRRSGARISRAPSVTTPTPLIRRRLIQTPVSNDRAMFIARFFRQKRAHIVVKPPVQFVAAPPSARHPAVVSANKTSRVKLFFRRKRAHIIVRSPVQFVAPPAAMRHPAIVSPHRRARVKHFFARKRRIFAGHGAFPAVIQPAKRPLVSRVVSRRPARIRALRRRPIIAGAKPAAPTRTTHPIFVTSNGQRRTRRVAYYARHRVHLEFGPLATSTIPAVVVTAVYDPIEPAAGFDRTEPTSGFDSQAIAAGFDRSEPTGGFDAAATGAGFDRSQP